MSGSTTPPVTPTDASQEHEFSLVRGGPLFQLLQRTGLVDQDLRGLRRRILIAILLLWAPVLALSVVEGGPMGRGRTMPALYDIGFHLRFLVVVPLLIGAEVVVHRQITAIVGQFLARSLIPRDQIARFADALRQAERLRNSAIPEAVILATVYGLGVAFTLQRFNAVGVDAWYMSPSGSGRPSLAGLWLALVSLPVFQFLLLRWYFRIAIWAQLLWRASRIDLDLHATHPDRSGGLGFLSDSLLAFAPLAIAHGLVFAGAMADRILFAGAKLPDFQLEVLSGAIVVVVIFAGPLAIFAPRLLSVRQTGVREYGALGQDYVRQFQNKWFGGRAPDDEPLIGSADIQSLADLGNSFSVAEQMRLAPIRPLRLVLFVAAFAAPMLPLLLTVMSPEKLIASFVGVMF